MEWDFPKRVSKKQILRANLRHLKGREAKEWLNDLYTQEGFHIGNHWMLKLMIFEESIAIIL